MSGSDMKDLATLATLLGKPEMERRSVWHALVGKDHWALLLIRHKRKGSGPEQRISAPRLSSAWRRKVGEGLPPQDVIHEWITRYLEAEIADNGVLSVPKAASAARDAVLAALDYLGVELPTAVATEENR